MIFKKCGSNCYCLPIVGGFHMLRREFNKSRDNESFDLLLIQSQILFGKRKQQLSLLLGHASGSCSVCCESKPPNPFPYSCTPASASPACIAERVFLLLGCRSLEFHKVPVGPFFCLHRCLWMTALASST